MITIGNYGGGSGSWLIVVGCPFMNKDGKYQECDLTIRKANKEEEFENAIFTKESHPHFHTKKGLPCTINCPYCGSEHVPTTVIGNRTELQACS